MLSVSIMANGRYQSHHLSGGSFANGSWSELANTLQAWAMKSNDGLASFDTDTTRHNVWTHPECTGGLEATIDSQSY